MRQRGFLHSLGLHAILLLVVIFGLPHFGEDELMQMAPIPVELVAPSDITTAPPKAQPRPEPPKPEPPKPEPPKPAPPPEPTPPAPDDVPLPAPDAPKSLPELQPPKPPKDKPKPPVKKVDKKPPPKTAKNNDFSKLLNNLSQEEAPDTSPQATPDAPESAPTLASALNISELDAVRQQVMGCWLEPTGLREGEKLVVEVRVVMNRDRTVQRAEIVDKGRMRADPFYRTLGESAIRALYNPRCNPLLLPPDKYNTWRVTTFRFSPGEIF